MKLCECGCGNPAPIAPRNNRTRGLVKGEPMRFIRGHNGSARSAQAQASMVEKLRARIGSRARGWRGGVSTLRNGRVLVFVGRDHPMANGKGYCYQHRLVMSELMGRPLSPTEHVHHIDLNPANNKLSNLVLVSRSEHSRIHMLVRKGAEPGYATGCVLAGPKP